MTDAEGNKICPPAFVACCEVAMAGAQSRAALDTLIGTRKSKEDQK